MNTASNEDVYVRVSDEAGDDLVCPLEAVTDGGRIRAAAAESCIEQEVIGRYAGQLKIVDAVA
jgi:hypothetical protein